MPLLLVYEQFCSSTLETTTLTLSYQAVPIFAADDPAGRAHPYLDLRSAPNELQWTYPLVGSLLL